MPPRTVLVTGMSGLIGTALRRHLEGRYELRALNRRPLPGMKCHQADIADLDAITPIFDGVDTDNRWGYRDLEHARAVLGFEPRDQAEDHRR